MGKNKNERELIEQVASMYYEKGISQADIAKRLYFSRAKISRLIKEAKENNYVRISVTRSNSRRPFLEEEFRKLFGIEDIVILSAEEPMEKVYQDAADYIDRQITPNSIIAVSRGRTITGIVKKLNPVDPLPITVIQVAGMIGLDRPGDEIAIARDFAQKYGGNYLNLLAPAFVEDEKDLDVLRKYTEIDKTFEIARKADMFITSVAANTDEEEEMYKDIEDPKKRPVGTMVGRYLNEDGEIIEGISRRKVVSLDTDDMRKMKDVIVVSFGTKKAPILTACLRGKWMTKLITDQRTAIDILIRNGKMI